MRYNWEREPYPWERHPTGWMIAAAIVGACAMVAWPFI